MTQTTISLDYLRDRLSKIEVGNCTTVYSMLVYRQSLTYFAVGTVISINQAGETLEEAIRHIADMAS